MAHARYPTKFLEDGSPNPDWRPRKPKPSLAERGFFVAWDGEGYTDERGQHHYTMIMAAWQGAAGWEYRWLRNKGGGRLGTLQILRFIERVLADLPQRAIHIGFALTYDITHILRDLPWVEVKYALHNSRKVRGEWLGYRFKVRQRKQMMVWMPDYKRGDWRRFFNLWDVFGFFQTSLVASIERWLGADYPDLSRIKEGKARRGENYDEGLIEYTQAELRALILMMVKLNEAFLHSEIRLARWDGPGAAATAAFKRYMPKDWFIRARQPFADNAELYEAVRGGYFGGRIELIRYGVHRGALYNYDLNSAYPAALVEIPDITAGEWRRGPGMLAAHPMTIYRVRWDFTGRTICPFPLRDRWGNVSFPERGEGWYWHPEVLAAITAIERDEGKSPRKDNYAGCSVVLLERWGIAAMGQPFSWVRDLYQQRLAAIATGEKGLQMAIKLVINSLYGKTAQHLGYVPLVEEVKDYETGAIETFYNDKEELPPFYNLALAGWITSHCRAKLFGAASQQPHAVVNLATDGLVTTKPLDLDAPREKILGAWEKTVLDDALLVMVQAGVSYLSKGGVWLEKSRGFSYAAGAGMTRAAAQRAIEERAMSVIAAWERGERSLPFQVSRLVTLKQAAAGEGPTGQWDLRGAFIENAVRDMELWPPESATKRWPVQGQDRPSEGLQLTRPIENIWEYVPISVPYTAIPLGGHQIETGAEFELSVFDRLQTT